MNTPAKQATSNKPVIIGLIVFVALLALTQFLSYQRYVINSAAEQREITNAANAAKERLQTALQSSSNATKTIAFLVEKYGTPKDFNAVAKPLLETNKFIDAIQLVKAGVITNVYPLKGNEAVIGYDILKDPDRKREALKAIEKNELYFSGPFELKQGGLGIVGRQPIFVKKKFWGFSAVVIKLPTLLKAAGIDSTANKDYIFQLSKINSNTQKEEFFLPQPEKLNQGYFVSVFVPEGDWKIYVQSKHSRVFPLSIMFVVLGIAFAALGGLFAWYFIRQPQELSKLVKEKTQQLSDSETNYRTTLGRVSDAFIALDKNWRYTFLNDAALVNHPLGREATMGKVIWDVHPEMEGTIFQQKYHEAMQTGKATEVESYYQPMDSWFSAKIYPSVDGLTVFYKDITENKKAEQQIIREKTLSDSVINSLPGLFYLYDENGKFLRWNKNFETISGYSDEEISKMHPLDFFADDEKKLLAKKIQSVFSGGSDDVEANFFTKDKRKIPYYFNGWITQYEGKKCLLGVAIDITERKKTETELRTSIERFNLTSKATNDIIWDWDLKTNAIWWNENFYTTFSYKHQDVPLVIDFWDQRLHPEDMQRVSDKLRQTITNHQTFWTDEYRFLDSHNNTFYIYDRGYILYDKDNQPLRMIGAMINITDRKIAEQKIITEKELSDTIINSLPGIFYLANQDGILIRWNNNFETVSGYNAAELASMRGISFFDSDEQQMMLYKKQLVFEEGSAELEANFVSKNRIKTPYFFTGRRISYNNKTAFLGVGIDISERKKAEDELNRMNEQLRLLSAHLQTIREEERTHIAREIHDELGQQLTGLKMDIAWIKNKSEKEFQFPLLREKTNDMIDLVNQAIASVRKIAKELRPGILDDLGLEAAIEWQANEFSERTGIALSIESTLDSHNFSKDINTAVFRIFQESLTNIMRHAEATAVVVRLYIAQNSLILEVIDNGKGIPDERKNNRTSLGLLGMNERAVHLSGTFTIENHLQGGTIVTVKIPLPTV